jgi:hypothetical protein
VFGFGRTIALRRFIAVQQFRAGFETEFAAAAMSAAGCSMQFVLPNRTPLPATCEAGLVQIANSLIEVRVNIGMSALRKFSGSKGEAGAYKAIVFDELTVSLRLGGGVAAAGKMDISR